MKGSTYKRCKCRGDDGKELGTDCPKLRRKNGSWNPRHGVWYFRLELDPGPGGRRRTLRRGGYATETAAAAALDEAKALEARGGNAQEKILVGDFLDEWIAGRRNLSRSTLRRYKHHIAAYLKPHLGHLELDKLRVRHLDAMFAAIEAENDRIDAEREKRRALRQKVWEARQVRDTAERNRVLAEIAKLPPPRRPVGASTRAQIRATLRVALSDAARQEHVPVNVAKLIRMGGGRRPKAVVWTPERVSSWWDTFAAALEEAGESPESRSTRAFKLWQSLPRPSRVMVWTPEQTGAFLDVAAEYRLYALYHLMTFAGLRRGEACGLEWADVDLDARELSLYVQVVRVTYGEVEEADLKSEGSKDTIPFDAATGQVLRAWRAQQREERLAWGEGWVQSGKVFTRENGERLHPDHVSVKFLSIAFKAGLPPVRLHDLRHGTATLMLAGGADLKMVQAQLRHSSIALTADTYTSVLPDVARKAVEGGAALVPRASAAGSAGTFGLPSGSPPGEGGAVTPLNRTNQQVRASQTSRLSPPGDRSPTPSSTTHNVSDGDEP